MSTPVPETEPSSGTDTGAGSANMTSLTVAATLRTPDAKSETSISGSRATREAVTGTPGAVQAGDVRMIERLAITEPRIEADWLSVSGGACVPLIAVPPYEVSTP